MAKRIVCNGYMTPHGFAHGRMWFVCGRCRWSPNVKPEAPAPVVKYTDGTSRPIK